jgi:Putative zinc-finger
VTIDRNDEHPEELLTDLVDGALEDPARERVEEHLSRCERCREEVALARRARQELSGLPEADVPAGLDLAVRREARRSPSRRVWAIAGAAAAAGILAGGIVLVGQGILGGESDQAAAPATQEEVQEQGGGDGASVPSTEGKDALEAGGRSLAQTLVPSFTTSKVDYTPASLANLGRDLRDDARVLLEGDFPQTSRVYFANFQVESLAKGVREAVQCALDEVPASQPVVPILVQKASFEGTPAYVAAFLQGPSDTTPYDRLLIWVVDRETCTLRYYAAHRL